MSFLLCFFCFKTFLYPALRVDLLGQVFLICLKPVFAARRFLADGDYSALELVVASAALGCFILYGKCLICVDAFKVFMGL